MTKTNLVARAKKDHGNCRACQKPILKGDPYKWAQPRYGAKSVVCDDCQITPSMTSSSKMVAIWDSQESCSKSDPDDIRQLAETVREVGSEYQESCDNQREYFPDSETAQENEDKAQALDTWADELDEVAGTLEEALSEADSKVTECPE